MKNVFKTSKYLMLFAAVGMFACQDDIVTWDNNLTDETTPNGAPKIEYVAMASDTATAKTPITVGNLSDMIVIYGTNLSQVKSLYFNDVAVDLSTVYAVNSRIVVPVPRILPDEITNKIRLTTSQGSTEYDFTVTIPPLVITGLYNEFCSAGDTVDIVGNNFDLYDLTVESAQVSINGTALTVLKGNITALTVIIPAGTPDNTVIEISSANMDAPKTIKFRDFGQVMQDYGGFWGNSAATTDGTNSGDPKPLEGVAQFTRFAGDYAAWAFDWTYAGGYSLGLDVMASPSDYMFKFEINTNKAISRPKLLFAGTPNGDNTRFSWNPATGGLSFDTYGKWKTISIDFTELVAAGWNLELGSWMDFGIVYQPDEAVAVDFSIANARLVHK
jgi:hypothetical protein